MTAHFTRNIVAGIVVILPVAGTVLAVVYMESAISSSWLATQPFYFPGFGLLAAIASVYLIGLIATTVVGRWAWKRVDRLLNRVPALGSLYQTLKQILGYGEGKDAIFQKVVNVKTDVEGASEIGFVTQASDNGARLTVFLPGAPNPTNGRLVSVSASDVEVLDVPVSDVMRYLVSLGKNDLTLTTSK